MSSEKIQKILARAGLCSRRKAEELIKEGRVRVNGKKAVIGERIISGSDAIEVNGKKIDIFIEDIYLALNKPVGIISTVKDDKDRKTVIDLINKDSKYKDMRIFPVGRLDKKSEGLMILTNDGELTYRLLHPKYEVKKKYEVEVAGHPGKNILKKLLNGVEFIEGLAKVDEIEIVRRGKRTSKLRVVLKEGKKREIRRLLKEVGYEVINLRRYMIGSLYIGNLKPGEFRKLVKSEIKKIKQIVSI